LSIRYWVAVTFKQLCRYLHFRFLTEQKPTYFRYYHSKLTAEKEETFFNFFFVERKGQPSV